MIEGLGAAAGCFGGWVVALFLIGAVHATWTVGVSGGPNHGEHPFLVTVLHLIGFFVLARGWPWGRWGLYLGLLLATLALAVYAMSLLGAPARRIWAVRAVMAALHAAMFAVAWRAG